MHSHKQHKTRELMNAHLPGKTCFVTIFLFPSFNFCVVLLAKQIFILFQSYCRPYSEHNYVYLPVFFSCDEVYFMIGFTCTNVVLMFSNSPRMLCFCRCVFSVPVYLQDDSESCQRILMKYFWSSGMCDLVVVRITMRMKEFLDWIFIIGKCRQFSEFCS